jgi:outer membrane protein assembly factor BamE
MYNLKAFIIFITFCLLFGCKYFHIYQPRIQQGNIISKKAVSQLKIGMRPEAVLALMGTPLMVNTFDQNRWNYVYTFQANIRDHKMEEDRVILTFEHGVLTGISKDFMTVGEKP